MSTPRLSPNEKARLQARSKCALKTIERYPNVSEASRLRLEEAARVEGIALPQSSPPDAA